MAFFAGDTYGQPVVIADLPKKRKNRRGTCMARTRQGTLCQAPSVWNTITNKPINGRCKLHGGLSTGPRTEKGRESIRISNRRRAKNNFIL